MNEKFLSQWLLEHIPIEYIRIEVVVGEICHYSAGTELAASGEV